MTLTITSISTQKRVLAVYVLRTPPSQTLEYEWLIPRERETSVAHTRTLNQRLREKEVELELMRHSYEKEAMYECRPDL